MTCDSYFGKACHVAKWEDCPCGKMFSNVLKTSPNCTHLVMTLEMGGMGCYWWLQERFVDRNILVLMASQHAFPLSLHIHIYICTCKRLYLLETLICLIMTMEWFTLQLLWRPYFQNIHLYCSLGMVDLLQDTTLIVQANTLTDLILKVSVHMLTCFNYIIWHLNPKPVSLAFNALLQSKSRSKISERCLLKFQWNSQNFPDPRCPKCSQQTSDRVIR